MKSVLFILDYYLPNASANGICISKIVQEFLDKDINVSVVCYKDAERLNVVSRKKQKNAEKIYDIPCLRSNNRFRKITYYLRWIFGIKHLPAENKKLSEKMLRLVEKIVIKDKIDTVVCTHLPIETISIGKKLKNRYPYLNMVAYMLDSLSGGFLPRLLPKSFCRKKKIIWENKALSYFDRVILMESSRDHHENYSKTEEWYKKAHFLDVPALYKNENYECELNEKKDEIIISFVGTMRPGVRTPYSLLKVLSNITDLRIRFIIVGNNTCDNIHTYLKNKENIILDIRGEVSYNEAQNILGKSDFMVNLGNVNPNLVPSKIFEYMSYGKPIISTYTCGTDSSLPYLSKYPAVFLIDENGEDYKKIANQLKYFIIENITTKVPYADLEQNLYNNTPAALYDLLSSNCRENL